MFFCTNSNIWIVDAVPPPHPHSSILRVYRMALLHHGCWVVKPFIHSKNRICETCNILPPSSDIPSHPVRPHFPFQAIHQRVSSEWVAHVWRNTTQQYDMKMSPLLYIITSHHIVSHRIASQHLTHSTSQFRSQHIGYITNTSCRCKQSEHPSHGRVRIRCCKYEYSLPMSDVHTYVHVEVYIFDLLVSTANSVTGTWGTCCTMYNVCNCDDDTCHQYL